MTKESAKGNLIHAIRWNDMPKKEALEMAIKALEQCEVWNGIHGQVVAPKGTFDRIWEDAEKEEQEPKTGYCKWIKYDYRTICPSEHDVDNPYWRIPEEQKRVLKYCPYCGKEIEVIE